MPKAYWIAHVTVTDADQYKHYAGDAPIAFKNFGSTILARQFLKWARLLHPHEDLLNPLFDPFLAQPVEQAQPAQPPGRSRQTGALIHLPNIDPSQPAYPDASNDLAAVAADPALA